MELGVVVVAEGVEMVMAVEVVTGVSEDCIPSTRKTAREDEKRTPGRDAGARAGGARERRATARMTKLLLSIAVAGVGLASVRSWMRWTSVRSRMQWASVRSRMRWASVRLRMRRRRQRPLREAVTVAGGRKKRKTMRRIRRKRRTGSNRKRLW